MMNIIKFIEGNLKVCCIRIFPFTLNIPEKLLMSGKHLDFTDVFLKYSAKKRPTNCDIDLVIEVKPKTILFFGPTSNLLWFKLKEFKSFLEEKLTLEFIDMTNLLASASILFIKRKNRFLRPWIDYRNLNQITIKNYYPFFFFFSEMLDQLWRIKYDSRQKYNGPIILFKFMPMINRR